MRRVSFQKSGSYILMLLASFVTSAQISQQGYSTGIAGGAVSGGVLSGEVSTSEIGGFTTGESFEFYNGFAAANLETAVISVNVTDDANVTITDSSTGYLLKITDSGNYDTLDITASNTGSFNFPSVFHGDYLIAIDSDPAKYVATYYSNALLWEDAEVLELSSDTSATIEMIIVPPERNENTGSGTVSGTVEENFTDDGGRIDARRRAAKRKCGLRRKRSGGRVDQNNDEFELIAYGETNDNGEFEYGFLPEGTYRFFVEYPGIPIDESSFVEFEIGEAGVSDSEFVLAAVVSEEGIVVELILGITTEFFTDFTIYPNPTTDVINVNYDKILSDNLVMELIDLNGNVLSSKKLEKVKNGDAEMNVSEYAKGQYLLRFIDTEKGDSPLIFRIIKN